MMLGSEAAGQIRAVLYIQWLSVKNSLRRRSDFIGAVVSILLAVLWYGFWTAGAVGLFALAIWTPFDRLARLLPPIFFMILIYWQASPLLTATMGISIDLRKMALYPIGVRALFVIECLLRLLTGLEMILLLGGLSLGFGIAMPRAAPVFLPAVALFIVFNILLSAGLRNLLERLLRRNGFRELFLFLIVMASAAPQLILWRGSGPRLGRRIYAAFHFLPQSTLPSTAVARAFLGQSAAADWGVMLLWCAIAGWFGFHQFRRSFRLDAAVIRHEPARPSSGRTSFADRLYRLPSRLLPDPAAALVEKDLRYLARSARFRFLFLMGCSFGVVAWLPLAMRRGPVSSGALHASFLAVLSLYALLLLGQITLLNSLGLDRSAVRYFFLAPISPVVLLLSKNLVAGVVMLLQILFLAVICFLLRVLSGPGQVVEALVVTGIAALYLGSAGNFTSVMFGSALSPERVSRGGAGRGLQGLVVFVYPILISPVLAAYLARYWWHSTRVFVLVLAMGAVGGMFLYSVTLPVAARLSYRRREKLIQELSRGEGPLVSE